MVLGSEKLENMFFDDFEQNEKIGFLNFFNDENYFFWKKSVGQEMSSIFNKGGV